MKIIRVGPTCWLRIGIQILAASFIFITHDPIYGGYALPQNTQTASNKESRSDIDLKSSHNDAQDAARYQLLNLLLANTSHTNDNDIVGIHVSALAWNEMENRYSQLLNHKVAQWKPFLRKLFSDKSYDAVGSGCRSALQDWLTKLADLDSRAWVMWNSWGNLPPIGHFEGSFSDLGSYRSCFSKRSNNSRYCMLDFQPLVPARPRFHSIFSQVMKVDDYGQLQQISQTASSLKSNRTNTNYLIETETFSKLASKAHFFYYLSFRIGTCWPEQCNKDEIELISRSTAARYGLQSRDTSCMSKIEWKQSYQLNTYQWSAVVILGSFASFVLLITLLDFLIEFWCFLNDDREDFDMRDIQYESGYKRNMRFMGNSRWTSIFCETIEIYSIRNNFFKIFRINHDEPTPIQTETSSTPTNIMLTIQEQKYSCSIKSIRKSVSSYQALRSDDQLDCLNGLRVISTIWIIYGHTLLNIDYNSFTHFYKSLEESLTNPLIFATLVTNFSVDTFFVISGLLNTYVVFTLRRKLKYQFDFFSSIIARYLRLTPQLIVTILLFFLLPLLGDGPLYRQGTQVHADRCYKNYWLNLLYIQTYIDRKNMCIIGSWWISIEMTFYVISMLVVYMLTKSRNPQSGLIMNGLIMLAMTLVGAYIHYSNGFAIQYMPSIPQMYEVEFEQTQKFFHRPYPHSPSYFMGLALGYFIATNRLKPFTWLQQIFGWLTIIFCISISLLGSYSWNEGRHYSQLLATTFYMSCQILWPIGISLMIIICINGQGRLVNKILSSKFLVPLSKITYMTYLTHMLIVYYFSASLQRTCEPTKVNLILVCVSNIVLSFILGTILSLVYESPLIRLLKRAQMRKFNIDTAAIASNGLTSEQRTNRRVQSRKSRLTYRKTLQKEEEDDG